MSDTQKVGVLSLEDFKTLALRRELYGFGQAKPKTPQQRAEMKTHVFDEAQLLALIVEVQAQAAHRSKSSIQNALDYLSLLALTNKQVRDICDSLQHSMSLILSLEQQVGSLPTEQK